MFDFITKTVSGIFGNKSEKDVKALLPVVAKINAEFSKLQNISHDELRGKTTDFKNRIKKHLAEIDKEIAEHKSKAEKEDLPMDEKEELYKSIDKLIKERDKKIEEILNEILPEAFATVKETARRFKENQTLTVTATELDKNLSVKKEHIKINNEQATFHNSWIAAGNKVTWNMLHYDVQLIGGIVLHQGKISEMATGEGKTLVATLPAYLNALAREGVHIVTVNDYLASRDSEWMGPIFEFLGITVDCIDKHQPNSPDRRKAYNADITYGTNNEFGFDYLRDNMVRFPEEMVQRKHHYAMVDEVDSVLIDDARTPLIISGPVDKGDEQEFHALKPRIQRLVETQKKVVNNFLNDAKKQIADGRTDEKTGGLSLFRAHRGLPKSGALIKFMSEAGMKNIMQKTENYFLQDNQKEMPKADEELYFVIDEKNNSVELAEKGIQLITESGEDANFFILPNVGAEIAEIEKANISDEEKIARKDKLMTDFSIKSERVHSVQQLLKAYTLFEKDIEYVVMDGKVKIVDENTGRILDGRRYSDGLHQAIEAKENVKVEAATQTFATVTLQNFFRMYHKLCGMTGTAETEAGEFWSIYKLDVVVIPPNVDCIRDDREDFIYKTKREKYNAVIAEIETLKNAGRPVLVGTTSVEVSELIGKMLKMRGMKHNVLNAKQHQREADIIAEAGQAGTVTISTNMAGRGTDIKLGPTVKEAGGLAIIGTERHEARRVDRQLRGRAGRQGDPGTSQFYASLEDDLMRLFGSDRIAKVMDSLGYKEGEVIQHSMITKSIERAQRKVEENNFGIRKRLLEYDDVMNSQREIIYKKRRHALFGERLSIDLNNMIYDVCEDLVHQYKDAGDYEGFKMDVIRYLSIDSPFSQKEFSDEKTEMLANKLFSSAIEFYKRKTQAIAKNTLPIFNNIFKDKGQTIENVVVPFSDGKKELHIVSNLKKTIETEGKELITAFEKNITLAIVDDSWKEHLREMDELKQSVQSAVYEQKDPLLVYKFEAFELFKRMLGEVNREVTAFLFKGNLSVENQKEVRTAGQPQHSDMSRMRAGRDDTSAITNPERARAMQQRNGGRGTGDEGNEEQKLEPVRVEKKVGRNEPCPCGSGKKYKNCHGRGEN